jgi:hypothetical protein
LNLYKMYYIEVSQNFLSQRKKTVFDFTSSFFSSYTSTGSSSFLHSLLQLSSGPQTPGFKLYNSRGLSGQPCLTPFVVSNYSPSFSPTFTLFFVLAYVSSICRTSHSLIPLYLIRLKYFLSIYLPCQTPP